MVIVSRLWKYTGVAEPEAPEVSIPPSGTIIPKGPYPSPYPPPSQWPPSFPGSFGSDPVTVAPGGPRVPDPGNNDPPGSDLDYVIIRDSTGKLHRVPRFPEGYSGVQTS